jgi:succinate dehydrogenase / fumarate reductase cytochrome b subunit
MTSLALTITETLRYRGKIGQWSWVLHRISGLGTLLFLFLHVIDTSWSVFYPDLYRQAISEYQSPLFTLGEFALVACVIYHGINGFRIILLDWRPRWWKYQQRAATIVMVVTLLLLIPTFVIMGAEAIRHYTSLAVFDISTFKIPEILADNARFVAGAIGALIFGLVVSVIYSFIPGRTADGTTLKRSRFDQIMWLYMRISGVLILPLVFGHIGMMHVIQGVFHITTAGYVPVGATSINQTGSAVEFVSQRWNTMFAGVFIWRIYDIALLAFVVLHGFYGLHYVMNDYVHNKRVNRGVQIAIFVTALTLLILGSLAIINTLPTDTAQMLAQAAAQGK